MRAACPGCGRVAAGVPHVLPFLHKSLGEADVQVVARLAALETPGPEQSSSVSLAPACTDRLTVPAAWGGTEVLAGMAGLRHPGYPISAP